MPTVREQILARPHEAALRLKLAEELAREGRHLAAHLIRTEYALEHATGNISPDALVELQSSSLIRDLTRTQRIELMTEVARPGPLMRFASNPVIRLGQVEGLDIQPANFIANREEIIRGGPITRLRVFTDSAEHTTSMLADPWLKQIRHLTIVGAHMVAAAGKIVSSRNFTELRSLTMVSTNVAATPAAGWFDTILKAPYPSLGELKALKFAVVPAGAYIPDTAIMLYGHTSNNGVSLEAARSANSVVQRLEALVLYGSFRDLDTQALMQAGQAGLYTRLTYIALENPNITEQGLLNLTGVGSFPSLRSIRIDGYKARSNAMIRLLSPSNIVITATSLDSVMFGAARFFKDKVLPHTRTLSLFGPAIDDETLELMARNRSVPQLKRVSLKGTFSAAGVEKLLRYGALSGTEHLILATVNAKKEVLEQMIKNAVTMPNLFRADIIDIDESKDAAGQIKPTVEKPVVRDTDEPDDRYLSVWRSGVTARYFGY